MEGYGLWSDHTRQGAGGVTAQTINPLKFGAPSGNPVPAFTGSPERFPASQHPSFKGPAKKSFVHFFLPGRFLMFVCYAEGMTPTRPPECCGVCPETVSGGYDCTCKNNPRCPNYEDTFEAT